jgi:signal transduction histidine kinase
LHTYSEYEGTGLGLATCKKIVDEFEGSIDMTSEVGTGTIFKIELPDHLIAQ